MNSLAVGRIQFFSTFDSVFMVSASVGLLSATISSLRSLISGLLSYINLSGSVVYFMNFQPVFKLMRSRAGEVVCFAAGAFVAVWLLQSVTGKAFNNIPKQTIRSNW